MRVHFRYMYVYVEAAAAAAAAAAAHTHSDPQQQLRLSDQPKVVAHCIGGLNRLQLGGRAPPQRDWHLVN